MRSLGLIHCSIFICCVGRCFPHRRAADERYKLSAYSVSVSRVRCKPVCTGNASQARQNIPLSSARRIQIKRALKIPPPAGRRWEDYMRARGEIIALRRAARVASSEQAGGYFCLPSHDTILDSCRPHLIGYLPQWDQAPLRRPLTG